MGDDVAYVGVKDGGLAVGPKVVCANERDGR